MKQNTDKYSYKQLETYKEILELKHIKTKTLIVNIIQIVFAFVVTIFLYELDMPLRDIWVVTFMFGVLVLINVFLYSLQEDLYNNLKIAMYINTIGQYVIATTLILIFQTPSIFTALFLAYAISSIYQDYKVMLISNSSLFIIGFLLTLNFNTVFDIPGNTAFQNTFIVIFLFLFVLLLTLSSYIMIKRKAFFYNHLAKIKESEVRNMDLLAEMEQLHTGTKLQAKEYYRALLQFSRELSKKIGIENVFKRKIELLKEMGNSSPQELIPKYPEYTQEQMNRMKHMELSIHTKMRNIAMKASRTIDIEVSKKEIFSESQFKSFKHVTDERYVKIIAFVVFYVLLKMDKPYLNEMNDEEIKDILYNSEYLYLIDPDILDVYFNNNEVFETVVNDILKEEWNYAPHR